MRLFKNPISEWILWGKWNELKALCCHLGALKGFVEMLQDSCWHSAAVMKLAARYFDTPTPYSAPRNNLHSFMNCSLKPLDSFQILYNANDFLCLFRAGILQERFTRVPNEFYMIWSDSSISFMALVLAFLSDSLRCFKSLYWSEGFYWIFLVFCKYPQSLFWTSRTVDTISVVLEPFMAFSKMILYLLKLLRLFQILLSHVTWSSTWKHDWPKRFYSYPNNFYTDISFHWSLYGFFYRSMFLSIGAFINEYNTRINP